VVYSANAKVRTADPVEEPEIHTTDSWQQGCALKAIDNVLGSRSMAIVLCGLAPGCGMPSMDLSLPFYTMEQTDSAHPGYRQTTVSSKGAVYVNDFDQISPEKPQVNVN
jgi:hypothetical protein